MGLVLAYMVIKDPCGNRGRNLNYYYEKILKYF